jgi:subtilisin
VHRVERPSSGWSSSRLRRLGLRAGSVAVLTAALVASPGPPPAGPVEGGRPVGAPGPVGGAGATRGVAVQNDANPVDPLSGTPTGVPDLHPRPGRSTQLVPNGVRRTGGDRSVAVSGDGQDPPGLVLPGVAVLDSFNLEDGRVAAHPDLNIVESNGTCANLVAPDGRRLPPHPLIGPLASHGLNTAGVIGAVDNAFGVVGVAPGAPIHAFNVVNSENHLHWGSVACALDHVARNAATIKVVNLSFMMGQFAGLADPSCGTEPDVPPLELLHTPQLSPQQQLRLELDLLHASVCGVVAAGVTVVASAANDSVDLRTNGRVPAVFEEVITVSGLADHDGVPGGLAAELPQGCPAVDPNRGDDVFGSFSNNGPQVDLIAPGTCALTTSTNGQYAWFDRTSAAAPHVAGAAALYLAQHPAATPAEVEAALTGSGTLDWEQRAGQADGDDDGIGEPLLNVAVR